MLSGISGAQEQQPKGITPYDAHRQIQQLNTVIERELHFARKLFSSDNHSDHDKKNGARQRLLQVAKLENKRRTLQNVLAMPKFPALPLTIDLCDAELATLHDMRPQKAIQNALLVLQAVDDELSVEYSRLRNSFGNDRERTGSQLDAIRDLERRQFYARRRCQEFECFIRRTSDVENKRHELWLENYCRGYDKRIKLFTMLCTPRVLNLQRSPLMPLPLEIIRLLDSFLYSATERSASARRPLYH